eukprot:Nitzschia sp. Nitz4//scaffold8_size234185//220656//221290//NITZ4_001306-RA/size234185-processed-gene-0.137-mRNA-1//1//CDS//3329559953//1320//frame0
MGNSGSQPQSEQAAFSLSEELQEQMAQEYNNEQIVKLFGKQMEKLGERKAGMLKSKVEERAMLQQHMEQFRAQNQQVQQQLDTAIESLEDRFTDSANILEYDAARLEKRYLNGKYLKTIDIPCLHERQAIASCYETNQSGDPSICNALIESLTDCTTKTITAK